MEVDEKLKEASLEPEETAEVDDKKPTIEVEVETTLQEFYNGCVKTIAYERDAIAADGDIIEGDLVTKSIEVAKGMSDGDSLNFVGEGHQGWPSSDLKVIFKMVDADPESENYEVASRYTRKGDDLYYRCPVNLAGTIRCLPVKIPLLDGRLIPLALDEIVTPKTVRVLEGEGIKHYDKNDPLDKNPRKGNLYINFIIGYPKTSKLSWEKKKELATILAE